MTDGVLIINCITAVYLVTWGACERIFAIRREKKSAGAPNRDRSSLVILYITILPGYGVGIPVAYTEYGRISIMFPYLSLAGFAIIMAGLPIRLIAIRTLAEHFTGCGIAFASWWSMLFLILPNFLAALHRAAIEEKVLIDYFKGQYQEYIKRTKLLIPGVC